MFWECPRVTGECGSGGGRVGSEGLSSFGSGELVRKGEYSTDGNTGWILEESPVGELGRKPEPIGGGVAELALGDEWLEGCGDKTGDIGRGECCSTFGLDGFRGEGR